MDRKLLRTAETRLINDKGPGRSPTHPAQSVVLKHNRLMLSNLHATTDDQQQKELSIKVLKRKVVFTLWFEAHTTAHDLTFTASMYTNDLSMVSSDVDQLV